MEKVPYGDNDVIQTILKEKHLFGPNFLMDADIKHGINYFSGNQKNAYYELWGKKQVYRLLIGKLTDSLFTSKFIGGKHFFFLMEENEVMRGSVVTLREDMHNSFEIMFADTLSPTSIKELQELCSSFVLKHYLSLPLE
ncbi:hypothetical protein [Brevibacillus formosus]|uniref:hypothetical protein n=1 Tax=Brevibacillus formosus TaxID=54913 RepID=UPI003F19551F